MEAFRCVSGCKVEIVEAQPDFKLYFIFCLYLCSIFQIREHTGTLIMTSLVPSDEGNYTCLVENKYGRLQHTYQLNVLGKRDYLAHRVVMLV